MYIFTPGHQAASKGHIVLRMLGQSRCLQCPSLGMLSPLGEGREKREEEEQREERRRGKGGDERVEKGKGEEKR